MTGIGFWPIIIARYSKGVTDVVNKQRNECTMQLKLVNDTLVKLTSKRFAAEGVTFSQIEYLGYLVVQGRPVPLKELERTFKVSQPTVAGIVKRLRQKGLIVLEQDPQNYKSKTARLTTAGTALFEQAEAKRLAFERKLYHDFSAADLAKLQELLTRLYTNLTED